MADEVRSVLVLDDEARHTLARACRQLIESLTDVTSKAARLESADGYGELPSARELAAKFAHLGGPDGVQRTLRVHIATMERIESMLKKSFDQYDDADIQLMEQLSALGGFVQ